MDNWQQIEAEREMWDAIVDHARGRVVNTHLYRPMVARYRGKCDHCGSRIVAGRTPIRYSTHAPRGHKVLCEPCYQAGTGEVAA